MSEFRGREIAAGLPGYVWIARIVNAVEQRTGTPTRWNGRVFEELDPSFAGSADRDDGSLTVGNEDVMAPIERAYTSRELTPEDVQRAVDAAATVCHEARHLSSPIVGATIPAAHPIGDAPGLALDEGLVERWTHAQVAAVIADIGMDRDVPGSDDVVPVDSYPAYTSATSRLVKDVAASTGRRPRELEQQLLECDAGQRWNLIADLAIDQHLDGLMPDSDRDAVRARFANSLRADFGQAQHVQLSRSDDLIKRHSGTEIGARTVVNLNRDLEELADQYREAQPSQALGAAARGTGTHSMQTPSAQLPGMADSSTLHRAFAGQRPAAGAAVAPAQPPGATAGRRSSTSRSSGREGQRRS
jgi:hypothetical protein